MSPFADGPLGEAHVRAHRAFDAGAALEGHAALGWFFARHRSNGPRWTHLQWHQMVFEVQLGRIDAAHRRFTEHVAPAIRRGEALTDGPQALWRLALASPGLRLDWSDARDVAARRLAAGGDGPFVTWHHLLAVAGAGDLGSLEAFVRRAAPGPLRVGASALAAWVRGDHDALADVLARVDPARGPWAGSDAQNTLIAQLGAHVGARRAA